MKSAHPFLLVVLASFVPAAAAASRPAPAPPRAAPAAPPTPAAAEACAPIDKAGVAALFDKWNVALASLDPDAVARRYWEDAVLLPAASNTPRTSPAMVRDYYARFLEKHPRGRIDSRSIQVGCNLAFDMGTYTLSMMDASGTPAELAARYTYVYAWRDGEWRILHDHSSPMPEVLAAPMPAPVPAPAPAAAASRPSRPDQGSPVAASAQAAAGKAPQDAATVVDSTRMFLNAEASPPPMEFYPPEARSRRETGRVAMRVCADPEGRLVGEPKVLKSSGYERLDAAARQWARAAKWVPATSNRRSVEGCTEVTAQFRP
jgi:uncharacterized protein (TIGR02246 family)